MVQTQTFRLPGVPMEYLVLPDGSIIRIESEADRLQAIEIAMEETRDLLGAIRGDEGD